ncbi:MAG: nitrous oxide reductase [Rhodanobacteraceae bacterium]|nr:MAG: nitrous oxide reductase [Rhodanobacteraceae bacterium]
MKLRAISPLRRLGLVAAAVLVLGACAAGRSERPEPPVAIRAGDTSVGCGMVIDGSPGPRAEAYVDGYAAPLKFGSTRDFFAYVLQPEHEMRLRHLYVQNVATLDWQHPSDAAASFIDARGAYYVAWQPLLGMMGPTFAAFATRPEALAFRARHGGMILRFNDITARLVGTLGASCPAPDSPAFAWSKGCTTVSQGGIAAPQAASAFPAPGG